MSAPDSTTTILGVPSGAGAYSAGLELAPNALRDAGLVRSLEDAGLTVHDAGDVSRFVWRPDREHRTAQHVPEVARETREIADAGAGPLASGGRLLVLGGSCTVAMGVCAAMRGAGMRPQMLYVDRHVDLNTPRSTADGAFGWMGMAHALALDGAVSEILAELGAGPALTPNALSYLGVDLAETTEWERAERERLGIPLVTMAELTRDPATATSRALDALDDGPFAVHVDVDLLDFVDAPLAENVEGRNSGPSLDQLGRVLTRAWQHPQCVAMSIGQLHPAHAAGDPDAIPRFIRMLAQAMRPSQP